MKMKNIHVLSTPNPSRLSNCHDNKLYLDDTRYLKNYQNIYITNSEEIKEGDWCIEYDDIDKKWLTPYKPANKSWDMISKANYCRLKGTVKKIILTTDIRLAPDVQKIDDVFLEWFVKNPSCEEVEVQRGFLVMGGWVKSDETAPKNLIKHKIIIPKEEPKQETPEEAYNRIFEYRLDRVLKAGFIAGAKWQQEQDNKLYSEEEVLKLLLNSEEYTSRFNGRTDLKHWFEQFKKK